MSASRRVFLGAATAAGAARVAGAAERVRVGVIGYGLIGARHLEDFKAMPDVEVVAVADAYKARVDAGVAAVGGRAKGYTDFRHMLDDKSVDAVVVATPDHWHALQTILACAAGKDVYVEKPVSLFVNEGRWMTAAARRYKRIVQTGTQQRSGGHYQRAIEMIRGGALGKVHSIRAATFRNIMPGFGRTTVSDPPSGLDYDMWLGPAPKRDFTRHRGLYHFRWFWDFAGGQMTNLGAHEIDVVHWAMQVNGPRRVACLGGRFALENDDGETPDTQDAVFLYPGFTTVISVREACAGRAGAGFEIYGTKASMRIGRTGFDILPEMRQPPENLIPDWSLPPGHPGRVPAKPTPWTEAASGRGSSDEQMAAHKRNFVDCIRSRKKPNADIEDGHRVAAACHLANIAMFTGRVIEWDAAKETIVGDTAAAKYLERPYRKPWDDALRGLKL